VTEELAEGIGLAVLGVPVDVFGWQSLGVEMTKTRQQRGISPVIYSDAKHVAHSERSGIDNSQYGAMPTEGDSSQNS
jgi:hypothetical protein